MKLPSRHVLITVFGALVLISGVYRKLSAPEGWPAFWFGVVVGSGMLLGSWLIRRGWVRLGFGLGWIGLGFVVGWFGYECLIKKPWAEVEWRPLTELILGTLTMLLMLWPRREATT